MKPEHHEVCDFHLQELQSGLEQYNRADNGLQSKSTPTLLPRIEYIVRQLCRRSKEIIECRGKRIFQSSEDTLSSF